MGALGEVAASATLAMTTCGLAGGGGFIGELEACFFFCERVFYFFCELEAFFCFFLLFFVKS